MNKIEQTLKWYSIIKMELMLCEDMHRTCISYCHPAMIPSIHQIIIQHPLIILYASHIHVFILLFLFFRVVLRCAVSCSASCFHLKRNTHKNKQCAYVPNKCFNDILCVLYYRLFIVDHMREGDAAVVTFRCRRKQPALAVYQTCFN